MQKIILYPLTILAILTISTFSYGQTVVWLQGVWQGRAYLPENSNQHYNLILEIEKTKGKKFEGILKTIQPADTSIRFDTKVSGSVDGKRFTIQRNKIVYVKSPPNVKWQVSCDNCRPPQWSFAIENGKFLIKGEVKNCQSDCNWISEFSRDINEFGAEEKDALYTLINDTRETGAETALTTQDSKTPLPRSAVISPEENLAPTQRTPVLPSGDIISTKNSTSLQLNQHAITSLNRKTTSMSIMEAPATAQRIPILPSGDIISTKNRTSQLNQHVTTSLTRITSSIPIMESTARRIPILSSGDIISTKNRTTLQLNQHSIASLNRKTTSMSIMEAPETAQRIPILPSGDIVSIQNRTFLQLNQHATTNLTRKTTSMSIMEALPTAQRIPILPSGNIISTKNRTSLQLNQHATISLTRKTTSILIMQNVPPSNTRPLPSPVDTISLTGRRNLTAPQKTPELIHDVATLLPSDYTERKKNVIRTLTVNTDSLVLSVYDNGVVDGDVVSIIYNDKVVVDKLSLTSRALVIKIPVNHEGTNTLVFHAHNLGDYPPNTAKLEILYGNKKEELTVSSDYTTSSTIDIVHQN